MASWATISVMPKVRLIKRLCFGPILFKPFRRGKKDQLPWVFEVCVERGLVLAEIGEGVSLEEVRADTGASFQV